jgi:hypothetical protein
MSKALLGIAIGDAAVMVFTLCASSMQPRQEIVCAPGISSDVAPMPETLKVLVEDVVFAALN